MEEHAVVAQVQKTRQCSPRQSRSRTATKERDNLLSVNYTSKIVLEPSVSIFRSASIFCISRKICGLAVTCAHLKETHIPFVILFLFLPI